MSKILIPAKAGAGAKMVQNAGFEVFLGEPTSEQKEIQERILNLVDSIDGGGFPSKKKMEILAAIIALMATEKPAQPKEKQ